MTERNVVIRLNGGMAISQVMDDALLATTLNAIFISKKVFGIFDADSSRQIWIQCSNVSMVEFESASAQEFREAMGG